eukprot:5914809-Karenia_brevis.AAC.1
MPSIEAMLRREGVIRTKAHQCAYNHTSCDEQGDGLVYKPTAFMTNSPFVAEHLNKKCTNANGMGSREVHRHVHLVNGRARKAQVYPPDLCKAMCMGIKDQKDHDEKGEYFIGSFDAEGVTVDAVKKMKATAEEIHEDYDKNMVAIDD